MRKTIEKWKGKRRYWPSTDGELDKERKKKKRALQKKARQDARVNAKTYADANATPVPTTESADVPKPPHGPQKAARKAMVVETAKPVKAHKVDNTKNRTLAGYQDGTCLHHVIHQAFRDKVVTSDVASAFVSQAKKDFPKVKSVAVTVDSV